MSEGTDPEKGGDRRRIRDNEAGVNAMSILDVLTNFADKHSNV